MADKPYGKGNPEKGWGQVFPLYFKENVKIENYAVNGRSSKSFINEGKWYVVLNKIEAGDYLIIEFGHNDSKKEDTTRFADAHTTYKNNLTRFIIECREKGGIPILATPIMRRRFDENKKFYDVHGDYPNVVREAAEKYNTPLLDLTKRTEKLLIDFGAEKSKDLFLHIQTFEYETLPEGRKDDTHLSAYGAFKVCDLAADELRFKVVELAKYLKD